jgi:hypothetical protein
MKKSVKVYYIEDPKTGKTYEFKIAERFNSDGKVIKE